MNEEIPKRLAPTKDVLIRLFAKSGNQCAFEGCSHNLFNSEGVFIAEVCHIEAALRGGERFNPDKTNEQRREENNLILFCKEHHKVTDNELEYSTARLTEIKQKHESKFIGKSPFVPNENSVAELISKFEEQTSEIYRLLTQLKQLKELNFFLNLDKGRLEPSKELIKRNLFYFTVDEKSSFQKISNGFLQHKSRCALITGHPSAGKTSFTICLAKKLQQSDYKPYYFQLKDNSDETALKNDITILGEIKTLLIFDDIHKNIPLATELYFFLDQFPNQSCIFISRELSKELQEIGENAFSIYDSIKVRVHLGGNLLEDKFKGIIETYRTAYNITESSGPINKIVGNCNANILKLYFLLEAWKEAPHRKLLSDITHVELNALLKKKYLDSAKKINDAVLKEYSSVYSFGIDFHYLSDKETKNILEGNGIIIEIENGKQLYEFWHSKFAELILYCLLESQPGVNRQLIESSIDAIREENLKKYLYEFPVKQDAGFKYPMNMLEIITQLSQQKRKKLLQSLLNDSSIFNLLINYLDESKPNATSLKELVKHLRFNSPKHMDIVIEKYVSKSEFINELSILRHGFETLGYIIISAYKVNSRTIKKFLKEMPDKVLNQIIKAAPLNSVTLFTRLYKNYSPDFADRVLNSLSKDEWREKLKSMPPFIVSNSLTEIKAINPIAAGNILLSADESNLVIEANKMEFFHYEKFISELKEIDAPYAKRIYDAIDDSLLDKKLNKSEASQVGKGLNSLLIINPDKTINAYKKLDDDLILQKLERESVKNTFRILAELHNVLPDKTNGIIGKFISSGGLNRTKDIVDLLTVIHTLKNTNQLGKINLTEAYSEKQIISLLEHATLENYSSGLAAIKEVDPGFAKKCLTLTKGKINLVNLSLTSFGQVLLKIRLVDFDTAKSILTSTEEIVFIRKSKENDINFHQIVSAFNEIRVIDRDFISNIFEKVVCEPSFNARLIRVNIDYFLHAVCMIYGINKTLSTQIFKIYKDHYKSDFSNQNIEFLKFCSGLLKFNRIAPVAAKQILSQFKEKLKILAKGLQFKELTTGLSDLAEVSPEGAKEILRHLTIDGIYQKALIIERRHLNNALGELRKVDKEWHGVLVQKLNSK